MPRPEKIRVNCVAGHTLVISTAALTFYQLHPVAVHRSWRCPCGLINVTCQRAGAGLTPSTNWCIARGARVVRDPAPDETAEAVRTWTDPWTDREIAKFLAWLAAVSAAELVREAAG